MIDQKKWFIVNSQRLKGFRVMVLDYLYTLLKFVQIPLIQEMISLSNFSHVSLFPPSMICSGSAAGLAGFAGTEKLWNMYSVEQCFPIFFIYSIFMQNKRRGWITYSCFIMPQLAIKLVFIFPHVTSYSSIVYLVVPLSIVLSALLRSAHYMKDGWAFGRQRGCKAIAKSFLR